MPCVVKFAAQDSADSVRQQNNLAEQMSALQAFVCLTRIGEGIFCSHGHMHRLGTDGVVQTLQLVVTGNETVEGHAHPAPWPRQRLSAHEVRDSPTPVASQSVDTMLEPLATGESQHGVQP